jgi:hypothetical protein
MRKEMVEQRKEELQEKVVKASGEEMKYLERSFGNAVDGKRSLWISMHGGGGVEASINEMSWRHQITLYAPEGGLWWRRELRPTRGTCGIKGTSTICLTA